MRKAPAAYRAPCPSRTPARPFPRLKDRWLKANCLASATKECSAPATHPAFPSSPIAPPANVVIDDIEGAPAP